MKLTTKGQYAVALLSDIMAHAEATGNTPVPLRASAERCSLSLAYSEQIARRLRRAGFIKAVRGPGGGYVPGGALHATTLKAVFDAVGEVQDFASLHGLGSAVRSYLTDTTMGSFI